MRTTKTAIWMAFGLVTFALALVTFAFVLAVG